MPLLQRFPRDQLLAVVQAYRACMAEGFGAGPANEAAKPAYLEHGGNPALTLKEPGWMISTVATQRGEWFQRPVEAYLSRQIPLVA